MSDIVTLKESSFLVEVGEINYQVLVDLKTLQGTKEPYFNATEIVKQYNQTKSTNKKLSSWKRSLRFKEIIKIWECDFNTPISKIYRNERVGSSYKMMVHKDLFLSLMIWLDAEHELAITKFVDNVVSRLDGAKLTRKTSKSLAKPMTDLIKVLKEKLDEEGSGAAQHYYNIVSNQIYKAATGKPASNGREGHDTLSDADNVKIAGLRASVEILIAEKLDADLTGRETKDAVTKYLHGFN